MIGFPHFSVIIILSHAGVAGCEIRADSEARSFLSLPFMPYSHHSHSGQFCKHAIGLLEDVVKKALDQGFEVYGLTEHAPRYHVKDLYPEEVIRLRLYAGILN